MKLRPLRNQVIVKKVEVEEKTASGLWIPEEAQKRAQEGIITAIGPGIVLANGKIVPIAFDIGDKVIFGKYSGVEVEVGEEKYFIIKESDLYAKVK